MRVCFIENIWSPGHRKYFPFNTSLVGGGCLGKAEKASLKRE